MSWGIHAKKHRQNAEKNRVKLESHDVHLTAPNEGEACHDNCDKNSCAEPETAIKNIKRPPEMGLGGD
jgi:hypothetical protein